MLARHIELFDRFSADLAEAVRRDDEAAILKADRALVDQLQIILAHHATDRPEIDRQIRFLSTLMDRSADDVDSVIKYKSALLALFARYLDEVGGDGVFAKTVATRSRNDASPQEMLLDSLDERVGVVGLDYRYIFTNERNAQFHQVRPSAFIGRHIVEFIGEERFATRVKSKLDQCFAGASLNYGYEIADANGQVFAVNCRMTPFRDGSDQIAGAIVMLSMQPVFVGAL